MSEDLLAGLIDGLIYVLAKEAKNRNINLNHEAQRANFDKDLQEYVNQVTKEIEEEEKAVIKVLSPSSEDKTYETLRLSNKKESLLEETTPTKVQIESRIEIDSKPGEEFENKMTKKRVMVEMEEPCSDSCPHTPLPLFKASLATGIPPKPPPIFVNAKERDPRAQLRVCMAKLLLILGILNSPRTWTMFMKSI